MKQAIVAVVDGPPVRALCWLLLAALVVRGLVLGATWRQLRADPDHYARLARNLAEHGMFSFHPPRPTAYRPPLYPLLLAPLSGPQGVRPAAVAALHLLLGLFTVAAVTICGRRMQLGRTALLAGALVALDPILMYQSSLVMTEALAAALAAAALWALASLPQQGTDSAKRTAPARRPAIGTAWRALTAGTLLGLASLSRPTFLAWIPAVAGACWWGLDLGNKNRRQRLLLTGLLLLASAIPVMLWAMRNARQMGSLIATTTHGGYTLWLANNHEYYDFLASAAWDDVWDSRDFDQQRLHAAGIVNFDERAVDRQEYAKARETMRQRPGMFVRSCVARLAEFWNPLPHATPDRKSAAHTAARLLVAAWYIGLYVLVGRGVWWLGRSVWRVPWCWGWSLVLVFSLVHTVYWTNLRMRAPVIPVLALLAARGASRRVHASDVKETT